MLAINTMRYGTDTFAFGRQSLLTTTKPFDTKDQTSVEGFTVSGTQTANTDRRVIFQVDGSYYYFVNGAVTPFPYGADFDNVITYGNTAAELQAVESIPEWVGKQIYPVIALSATADATTMPTIQLALKVRSNTEILTKIEESAIYYLVTNDSADEVVDDIIPDDESDDSDEEDADSDDDSSEDNSGDDSGEMSGGSDNPPRIIEITADTSTSGAATVDIKVRLLQGGAWSSYMELSSAANQEADAVQFQMTYAVTSTDSDDVAQVNSITVRYKTAGSATVAGDTAEIYTVLNDYENDLGNCYAVIKHKRLIDAEINAFVAFRRKPATRELISLLTESGESTASGTINESFILGVNGVADTGIAPSTIELYADGNPLVDFGYNVKAGTCQVTVNNGTAITASYEYGWDKEIWRQMTPQITEPYDEAGVYMTRFGYTLPESETADMQRSAVKFVLYRPSGTVKEQVLGTATGVTQMFVLAHQAKKETIECNAQWSYDDDTQILSVVGTKDTAIIISYEWQAETHEIYSYTCGWTPAV